MLGLYAPKISEETGADRGPNHDYSHDADAFGLMMCDYRTPDDREDDRPLYPQLGTLA